MADRSYGGRRDEWQDRGESIFTDDDRRERGLGGRDEERGFLERAGDEVRSWLGDEEAERRRERDMRRDEGRSAFGERDPARGGRYGAATPYGGLGRSEVGGRSGYDRSGWGGRGFGEESRGYGRREHGGRSGFAGQSQWDENYRRWRERQIAEFDREYEDYCRERQQQFDQEFDSWRNSRLTEGGTAGADTPRRAGGGRSATSGTKRSGATGAGLGGASATRASTGSSPTAEVEASAGGETSGTTRGRSGRRRG